MSRFDDELRHAIQPLAADDLPPDILDAALDEPPRSRAWPIAAGAAAVLVLAIGAGLGVSRLLPTSESPEPSASASAAPSTSQAGTVDCEDLAPSTPGNDLVFVTFPCAGSTLQTVETVRSIALDTTTIERLEVALRALLDGPTETESEAGAAPIVPPGSADLLADLQLQPDGLAILDFSEALASVETLSTSAAGGAFARAIRETAFQLGQVTAVELRLDGSCEALFLLLESTCQQFAKPIDPISDCPVIEPAELPSGAPITAARPYPGQPMVSWGSGPDTVTQLPGIRPAGGELGPGAFVDVRGYAGWVQPSDDDRTPDRFEIVWDEDGCRYVVLVTLDGGEEGVVEYASRFGPPVAEASPSPRPLLPSVVEADGIRLSLALDRDTTRHLERVTATVTIENIGSGSVFWGHSGTCVFPAAIAIHPGRPERLRFGRMDWEGEIGILKSVTVDRRLSTEDQTLGFWPEGWLDFEGNMGCTSDLVTSELRAGEVLVQRLEWDAYGYYGMPATPGTYSLEAAFDFMSRGAPPTGEEPIDAFVVRAGGTLTVEGEDVGYLHPGEAMDALLEDPGYLGLLADAPRSLWVESSLEFVDDRWEAVLWLSASDTSVDPVRALVGVVDARTGEVLDAAFEQRTRPGGG